MHRPGIDRTAEGTLHRGTPLRKVLEKACEAAEVRRITAHGLRRSFNDIVRRSSSRDVLRAITGHSNDRMTDHYSVIDIEEKRAAAATVLRLA